MKRTKILVFGIFFSLLLCACRSTSSSRAGQPDRVPPGGGGEPSDPGSSSQHPKEGEALKALVKILENEDFEDLLFQEGNTVDKDNKPIKVVDSDGYVTELHLSGKDLIGVLPDEIAFFKRLKVLDLQSNSLWGVNEEKVSQIATLESLSLTGNRLLQKKRQELRSFFKDKLPDLTLEIDDDAENKFDLQYKARKDLAALVTEQSWKDLILSVKDYYTDEGYLLKFDEENHLEVLILENSGLKGQIPSSIGSLNTLVVLNLEGNKLSGDTEIFGSFDRAIEMYLGNNDFSGDLSRGFAWLDKIEVLGLGNLGLTGEFPNFLVKNKKLRVLELHGNNFTGSPSSGDFMKLFGVLESITLNDNPTLSGQQEFREDLGQHAEVWPLKIFIDELDDEDKETLLAQEKAVLTAFADLTDKADVKAWLTDPKKAQGDVTENPHVRFDNDGFVRMLDLNEMGMATEAVLPFDIGNLSKLRALYIADQKFIAPFPVSMKKLVHLRHMSLRNSPLSGEFPIEIFGAFDDLRTLDIRGSSDPLSQHKLALMMDVFVDNCTVSYDEEAVQEIFKKEKDLLENLAALTENQEIKDAFLSEEKEVKIGEKVVLQRNAFGFVKFLDFSESGLAGELPRTLGDLVMVERLLLEGNKITGSLPDSIAQMKGLKSLDLSANKLSGPLTIAPFLGLDQLELLDLSDNSGLTDGAQFKIDIKAALPDLKAVDVPSGGGGDDEESSDPSEFEL